MGRYDMITQFKNEYEDNEDGTKAGYILGCHGNENLADCNTAVGEVIMSPEGYIFSKCYVPDYLIDGLGFDRQQEEAIKTIKTAFELNGNEYYTNLTLDSILTDDERFPDKFVFLLEKNIPEINVYGTLLETDGKIKCFCTMETRNKEDTVQNCWHEYDIQGLKPTDLSSDLTENIIRRICARYCLEVRKGNFTNVLTFNQNRTAIISAGLDLPKEQQKTNKELYNKQEKN